MSKDEKLATIRERLNNISNGLYGDLPYVIESIVELIIELTDEVIEVRELTDEITK